MSLNRARHRRAAETAKRRRASAGRFLKLKDDVNRVRLFPFSHVVNDYDVHLGRYTKADLKEGIDVGTTQEEIFCEFSKHFLGKSGQVTCTGDETCPVCEDVKQARVEEGSKSERASSIDARTRYVFNAVDSDAPEPKMQVLEVPTTVWEEVLEYLNDPEFDEDELLGCEGRDFVIKRDPDAPPAKMYTVRLRESKRCKALPKSLLADVTDLYLVPDFLPGHGLADFEVPDEIEAAMKAAGKASAKAAKPKRRSRSEQDDDEEAEEASSDEEAALAVGARVSVQFDGYDEPSEGTVKAVDDEGATITFDDGDEQDVPLDEITLLEEDAAAEGEPDDKADADDEPEESAEGLASRDEEPEEAEAEPVEDDGEPGEEPEDGGAVEGDFVKGNWVKFMLDGKPAYGQIVGDPDVNGVFEVMTADGLEFEMDGSEAELVKERDVPEPGSKPRPRAEKKPLKKKVLKKKKRAKR